MHALYRPNVILAAALTAKVADLGMAKVANRSATRAYDPDCHSRNWAAPEHILGYRCSTKADIYSFGVVCSCPSSRKHQVSLTASAWIIVPAKAADAWD